MSTTNFHNRFPRDAAELSTWCDGTKSGTGYSMRCPAHDDNNPSLSAWDDSSGKVAVNCHAGCLHGDVLKAFEEGGISLNARMTSKNRANQSLNARTREKSRTNQRRIRETMNHAFPIHADCAAGRYLLGRGLSLTQLPADLIAHDSIEYWEDGKCLGKYPALLAAVRRGNEIVALHRIYLTQDGSKANVSAVKKTLGSVGGGYVVLGTLTDDVVLCEGLETGLAVHQATGKSVLAVLTAGNLKSIELPTHIKTARIFADRDRSFTGQRAAVAARDRLAFAGIRTTVHLPDIELAPDEKSVDWLDVLIRSGSDSVFAALDRDDTKFASDQCLGSMHREALKERRPLPPVCEAPSPMLPTMIPEPLRAYTTDVARRIGVPVEFVAVPLMSYLAIVVGTKLGVFPKQRDTGWVVVCSCLWCAIIASSGKKKSPSLAAARKPLDHLERVARMQFEQIEAENEPQRKLLDLEIARVERQLKSKKSDSDRQQLQDEMKVLLARLKDLENHEKRYTTTDTTVEKLTDLLATNQNGLGLTVDELVTWMKNLERKGQEGARATFLTAWDGLRSWTIDRIIRGSVRVKRLSVVVIGGIQPGIFDTFVRDANRGAEGSDGLIQRFGLAIMPEVPKGLLSLDEAPNMVALRSVIQLFEFIRDLDPVAIGATPTTDPEVFALHFSGDAQLTFNGFLNELEEEMNAGGINESIESHLSKYRSTVPALALLFHLIKISQSSSGTGVQQVAYPQPLICNESAELAVAWYRWLKSHMRRIYGNVANLEVVAAHALSVKIVQGAVKDGMTVREVNRKKWRELTDPNVVNAGLEILDDCGWVNVVEERPSKGRPSSRIYLVDGGSDDPAE